MKLKSLVAVAVSSVILAGCNSDDSDDAVTPIQSRMDQIIERLENPNDNRDHVMIIAHRGLWSYNDETIYPEGSISSVEKAIELGIEGVELDIRITKDDKYVIMHDASVNRTTNCTGSVSSMYWDDLKKCNLVINTPDGTFVTGETVPSLEEIYEVIKDRILLNLDNKVGSEHYPAMFELAIEHGVDRQLLANVYMNSEEARERNGELMREWSDSDVQFMPNMFDTDIDLEILEEVLTEFSPSLVQLRNYRAPGTQITTDGGMFFTDESIALRDEHNTHYWINTLYSKENPGMRAGGRGDEMAVIENMPWDAYGFWVWRGATMFQTDEPEMMMDFLTNMGYRQPYADQE